MIVKTEFNLLQSLIRDLSRVPAKSANRIQYVSTPHCADRKLLNYCQQPFRFTAIEHRF